MLSAVVLKEHGVFARVETPSGMALYQDMTLVVPNSRFSFLFRAGFSPRGGIDARI
jgi:hypothetical protein